VLHNAVAEQYLARLCRRVARLCRFGLSQRYTLSCGAFAQHRRTRPRLRGGSRYSIGLCHHRVVPWIATAGRSPGAAVLKNAPANLGIARDGQARDYRGKTVRQIALVRQCKSLERMTFAQRCFVKHHSAFAQRQGTTRNYTTARATLLCTALASAGSPPLFLGDTSLGITSPMRWDTSNDHAGVTLCITFPMPDLDTQLTTLPLRRVAKRRDTLPPRHGTKPRLKDASYHCAQAAL